MEKINTLIAQLIAICNFSKDIHYNAKGASFYGKHLLADRVQDNLNEYIDQIKEICILGADKETLPSSEYLKKAIELIPEISEDDKDSFLSLKKLIIKTLKHIEGIKNLTSGESNLIGAIAQDLQNSLGLINKQVKDGE